MQKIECEFKLAKLDIFLKIKLDSGSICKYEELKLWHSCEIHLVMHDGNHEIDLCDRVSNKKKLRIKFNVVCNSSGDISSENIIRHIFVKITLNKNKVPSSCQNFSFCKNSLFVRYKSMTFNCWT